MMDIRCPYCDGPVYAWTDNISEETFVECENDDHRGPCGAQWNRDGQLVLLPMSKQDEVR